MKPKTVIGIDNGVTGTISVFVDGKLADFKESFIKKWMKPTVSSRASMMTRIDFDKLLEFLKKYKDGSADTIAVIERFMTDETRFHATLSSHHAQEATMIALEHLGIRYMTVDSKVWQKLYLGKTSGSLHLKEASKLRGIREYPQFKNVILKHGDADAIYIGRLAVDHFEMFTADCDRKCEIPKKSKIKPVGTNFKIEEILQDGVEIDKLL